MNARRLARSRTDRSRQLPFAAIIVATLALAQHARAQGEHGRIEGIVFDSVHSRPFAGAHVAAAGTGEQAEVRRDAVTDSAGRYRIDSLPAGRYLVAFESALLDSLEVALTPRTVTVASGQSASIDLAMPSAAKLRTAVCLGAALPPGTGVIYGHVVDAETEGPLAGAVLTMAWRDLSVERKRRVRAISTQRSETVVTDKDGWYRMCGVATGAWVSMQAEHEGSAGPLFRARVDDTLGIVIRHLSLATSSSRSSGNTADGPASPPTSGTAMLTGFVRGLGGSPVASAEVRVRGTPAVARTDALGAFTLTALPAGTREIEVRQLGYAVEDIAVELRSGSSTTANVVLRRIVNLDSVVVVASRIKYTDFYAHKSSGFGRFMGPEEIGKQRVSRTSEIIQKIPGFLIREAGYHTRVVGLVGTATDCRATIVVDGMRVLGDDPIVNDVSPFEIGAIEAYRPSEAAMAPPEYHIGGCGGIVIWTKR